MIFVLSATLLFFLFKKLDIQNCMRGDQHALKDDWLILEIWQRYVVYVVRRRRRLGVAAAIREASKQASCDTAASMDLSRTLHCFVTTFASHVASSFLGCSPHKIHHSPKWGCQYSPRNMEGSALSSPPRLTCNWGIHTRNDGRIQSNNIISHSIIKKGKKKAEVPNVRANSGFGRKQRHNSHYRFKLY